MQLLPGTTSGHEVMQGPELEKCLRGAACKVLGECGMLSAWRVQHVKCSM